MQIRKYRVVRLGPEGAGRTWKRSLYRSSDDKRLRFATLKSFGYDIFRFGMYGEKTAPFRWRRKRDMRTIANVKRVGLITPNAR